MRRDRPFHEGRRLLLASSTERRALLIRPDGLVALDLLTGQDLDATTLVRALGTWFGQRA
ncbi:aromatic-ring hydroxylase C-terminal domain-containing protein [Streptomyces sp. TLI_55]|uniref:aromatic-ring hydroxylase C-terminal domain-containing protein n=1 Tax=Streptomyces sp. TLI_55 TaxID=1938861 RepID=UPI00359C350B